MGGVWGAQKLKRGLGGWVGGAGKAWATAIHRQDSYGLTLTLGGPQQYGEMVAWALYRYFVSELMVMMRSGQWLDASGHALPGAYLPEIGCGLIAVGVDEMQRLQAIASAGGVIPAIGRVLKGPAAGQVLQPGYSLKVAPKAATRKAFGFNKPGTGEWRFITHTAQQTRLAMQQPELTPEQITAWWSAVCTLCEQGGEYRLPGIGRFWERRMPTTPGRFLSRPAGSNDGYLWVPGFERPTGKIDVIATRQGGGGVAKMFKPTASLVQTGKDLWAGDYEGLL